ncbi:MAG: hypothetical protein SXQ77_04760 [Halobacteria archaeon]|nr:hypothetical protein [Halobacteria archaeon]
MIASITRIPNIPVSGDVAGDETCATSDAEVGEDGEKTTSENESGDVGDEGVEGEEGAEGPDGSEGADGESKTDDGKFGKLKPAPPTKKAISAILSHRRRLNGSRNPFVAARASSSASIAYHDDIFTTIDEVV